MLSDNVSATWIDDEPRASRAVTELDRLRRRAMRRPKLTLGLAVLVTLGVVGWRARGVIFYNARATLRVTEGDLDPMTAPRAKGKLRGYVLDAAFTGPRLLEIIKRHQLYPILAKDDPNAAVTAMRRDIKVDVFMNYFLAERRADDPPRSARISISYRGRDPKVAAEVVAELARIVEQNEQLVRQAESEKMAGVLGKAVHDATEALTSRRREIIERELLLAHTRGTQAMALQLAVFDLRRSLEGLEYQLHEAIDRKNKSEFRALIEQERRGIHFEVVDMGFEDATTLSVSRVMQLIVTGLVGFLFALPFCAILVGAVDSRVYDGDDLRRLGLRPLGLIPVYGGDAVGALIQRRDARPGVR